MKNESERLELHKADGNHRSMVDSLLLDMGQIMEYDNTTILTAPDGRYNCFYPDIARWGGAEGVPLYVIHDSLRNAAKRIALGKNPILRGPTKYCCIHVPTIESSDGEGGGT